MDRFLIMLSALSQTTSNPKPMYVVASALSGLKIVSMLFSLHHSRKIYNLKNLNAHDTEGDVQELLKETGLSDLKTGNLRVTRSTTRESKFPHLNS